MSCRKAIRQWVADKKQYKLKRGSNQFVCDSFESIKSCRVLELWLWNALANTLYEIPPHDYPINAATDGIESSLCVDVMSNTFDDAGKATKKSHQNKSRKGKQVRVLLVECARLADTLYLMQIHTNIKAQTSWELKAAALSSSLEPFDLNKCDIE